MTGLSIFHYKSLLSYVGCNQQCSNQYDIFYMNFWTSVYFKHIIIKYWHHQESNREPRACLATLIH